MRKASTPTYVATLSCLQPSRQESLETAWLGCLASLPVAGAASSLYRGRGLHMALQAARDSGASLFVVSAGLGLVPADRPIPTYSLTVGSQGPDRVQTKVLGSFDSTRWWKAVSAGPFSANLVSVFDAADERPVLVALSQPYARLLAEALDALEASQASRLRIFGTGLDRYLGARIARQVLPYDERLDTIHRGTRLDFPQRALLHFVRHGLRCGPSAEVGEHAAWVRAALSRLLQPPRPARVRLTDEEIIGWIRGPARFGLPVGEQLRLLRREGVACEQARFSRLFCRARAGVS